MIGIAGVDVNNPLPLAVDLKHYTIYCGCNAKEAVRLGIGVGTLIKIKLMKKGD